MSKTGFEDEDEQREFNKSVEKSFQKDRKLLKKFNLCRSGYYWVRFKGDLVYYLSYFDLNGSMEQTERTFNHCGRDVHLDQVSKIHSRVIDPNEVARDLVLHLPLILTEDYCLPTNSWMQSRAVDKKKIGKKCGH